MAQVEDFETNPIGTQLALVAAIAYINENPCDPDVYRDQIAAWEKYLEALANLGLDRYGSPINGKDS